MSIFFNSRGAMFGLDARIALIIFTSLSIISGAVLYNSIRDAQSTSINNLFKSVVKAQEAYYLDVGKVVPNTYISDLVNNRESLIGWNGPYLPYRRESNFALYVNMFNETFKLAMIKRTGWSTSNISNYGVDCHSSAQKCFYYISLEAENSKSQEILKNIYNLLDEKYDNSDGYHKGNYIYREHNASDHRIYYRGMSLNYSMFR